jgi:hypothetical protein
VADDELRGADVMRRIRVCLVMVAILGPLVGSVQGQQPPAPNAFDVTDTNKDGRITPAEYRARMQEVFFLLDRNKDGSLVRSEISGASDAAYRAADKNGDGRLSMQEYIDARMSDFEAADQNKDGVLTREETAGK